THEFALFLGVVFAAYWLLSFRWVRPALVLLAAPYFAYTTWTCLAPLHGDSWLDVVNAAGASLWAAGELYWLSGIIGVAAVIACRVGHDRGRVWMLFLGSFYFYASWNQWLALLICVSTAMDYLIARGLDHFTSRRLRRLLLLVSLVANLGLLCYFKYAN